MWILALLTEWSAFLQEYRQGFFLMEYRALWTECRTLLDETYSSYSSCFAFRGKLPVCVVPQLQHACDNTVITKIHFMNVQMVHEEKCVSTSPYTAEHYLIRRDVLTYRQQNQSLKLIALMFHLYYSGTRRKWGWERWLCHNYNRQ